MLYGLGLITGYSALVSTPMTRISLDRGTATVSGSSSSHNFLLIAGVIGLLVILVGIVVVLLLLKHKRVSSREEPGDQRGLAFSNARPEYAQEYSRGTISAEQDPWPWAKKVSPPPVGYNPTTPVPEVLRVPDIPMMPMSEMSRVLAIPTTPAPQMLRASDDPTMPAPEVPVAPVVPVQDALQQPPILVPDPTLEAIMRQVQVGLFAMPVQHKGQKDRDAVL
jgi:septal ring-binding cell division protein DamX